MYNLYCVRTTTCVWYTWSCFLIFKCFWLWTFHVTSLFCLQDLACFPSKKKEDGLTEDTSPLLLSGNIFQYLLFPSVPICPFKFWWCNCVYLGTQGCLEQNQNKQQREFSKDESRFKSEYREQKGTRLKNKVQSWISFISSSVISI